MSQDYDRTFNEMTMDCDGDDGTGICTESLTLSGEFRECVDAAKRAGWSMRPEPDGDGWEHFCPSCTRRDAEWN